LATTRAIRRRIKSVKNISQVTRAMEMISASKMRRAQAATLASRAYAEKAWDILTDVAAQPGRSQILHPLLEERQKIQAIGIVLFTSDRGLCGAYNVNILRKTLDFMREQNVPVKLVTVGKRGREFMRRGSQDIVAEFTDLKDRPSILDIGAIAKIAIEEFTTGQVDRVYLAYTNFVNVLRQTPIVRQLLPIRPAETQGPGVRAIYMYEPDPESLLATILPRFTELQIYQAVLEAIASEQAARMVAMRNATDNAKDLISVLTLTYNKARQTSITKEMLDIAGGAEAQRHVLAM
jgi:F-type H+-transporting ATPase subunit gamma